MKRTILNSPRLRAFTACCAGAAMLNTESTYDWKGKQWSVPLNVSASKILRFGDQPVSLAAGVRYWADSLDNGPKGWGFRATVTFLFPQ